MIEKISVHIDAAGLEEMMDAETCFEQLSPLMEDTLRAIEIARAMISVQAAVHTLSATQEASIAISAQLAELTFCYIEDCVRVIGVAVERLNTRVQ